MRFDNKVVWITGASSGIGEGLAYAFHQDGAAIIISAPTQQELEPVKAKCTKGPGDVHVVPFDVTDPSGREEAVRWVLDTCKHVDILVNNAGIGQRASAKDTALELDRRIMEVNYFGAVALTKLVLPHMSSANKGIWSSPRRWRANMACRGARLIARLSMRCMVFSTRCASSFCLTTSMSLFWCPPASQAECSSMP